MELYLTSPIHLHYVVLTVRLHHSIPRSVLTKVVHTLLILPNTHPTLFSLISPLYHFNQIICIPYVFLAVTSFCPSQNIILALVYKDPQQSFPLRQYTKADIHKSNR